MKVLEYALFFLRGWTIELIGGRRIPSSSSPVAADEPDGIYATEHALGLNLTTVDPFRKSAAATRGNIEGIGERRVCCTKGLIHLKTLWQPGVPCKFRLWQYRNSRER
jgi:hypothetical protein